MRKEAASSFEEGAAFAAFCENFKYLLERRGLCLLARESQAIVSLFSFWNTAMCTYFENLTLFGINLSSETRNRWRSAVVVVRINDHCYWEKAVPEGCRPFLSYAESFFKPFFQAAYGVSDSDSSRMDVSVEAILSSVLVELSTSTLSGLFLQEAASFLPAVSDQGKASS